VSILHVNIMTACVNSIAPPSMKMAILWWRLVTTINLGRFEKMKIVGIKTEKGKWMLPNFFTVFEQSGPNTVEVYSRRLIKGHGWTYRIKKVEKNCEIFYQEEMNEN